MSKFIIALNEDVETLDSEQYDTLKDAKDVAIAILKELQKSNSKDPTYYEDEVSGYLDDEDNPIDDLTILEVTPASLPDLGYWIFDSLDDWCMSEGGQEDYLDGVTSKESNELNELVTSWLTSKGYTPNWFNTVKTYLVSLEAQHD